jgi:Carboxypeptidase regulatory-like domain
LDPASLAYFRGLITVADAMIIKMFQLSLVTLLISAVAAWASPSSGPARIQGAVRDSKGAAIAGAEVHIKSKDGSGLEKIVRTDAGGNYGASNLPLTDYEVVLFIGGQIKANVNNTKALFDKPTQLDFKLTGQYTANNTAKKHTHMVYMPSETGSNLGGRWVEVDDNTAGAAAAGANNVKRLSGEAVRKMQGPGTTGGN